MKAVVQRVTFAQVKVNGEVIAKIGPGLLTLLGVARGDSEDQLKKLLQKIIGLRIFEDDQGKMNRSLLDIKGEHLIVSQFTLLGDTSKGRRPHFLNAEEPVRARELFERSLVLSQELGVKTQGGQFGADMKVELLNNGPVTLVLDI